MSRVENPFGVRIVSDGDGLIVHVSGEIDLRNSPTFRTELLTLVDRKPRRVILDMSGVVYVDSSGVGTIVEFKRRLDRSGGAAVLAGLQPRVKSVFEITKLDQFFRIVATLDEARTR